jgi:hypothetical protein
MIREVITPQQTKVNLTTPQSYLHKKIEFIAFPVEQEKILGSNIESLAGSLSKYADITKQSLEDGAFANAMLIKHQ